MKPLNLADELSAALLEEGFMRLPAAVMSPELAARGLSDWEGFTASWDDLGLDFYMADGGRYRRRRHAVFQRDAAGVITRQPHRPHYQSRDYNTLNGGIARWFDPVTDAVAAHPALAATLDFAAQAFDATTPHGLWEIELHQFRISAEAGAEGRPTPEGLHRDGVDFVLVMLIRRENVESGVTLIEDLQHTRLDSFTLALPMDTTCLDDHRVLHGVTSILPITLSAPAFRDVLVATFRRI